MTKQKFNKTAFKKGDKIKFFDNIYDIISINFENKEFGYRTHQTKKINWIYCGNVKFIETK